MSKLSLLLEKNNCSETSFYDCVHQTLLTFVLEEVCKVMKNDLKKRNKILSEYYKTKDNLNVTDKIVQEYCGTKLPREDLVWVNKCLLANLKKRSRRIKVSYREKRALLEKQNYKCACCGEIINMGNSHYDHIIPWDFVGDELANNYQMLCTYCNEHKGSITYYMFKRQIIKKKP